MKRRSFFKWLGAGAAAPVVAKAADLQKPLDVFLINNTESHVFGTVGQIKPAEVYSSSSSIAEKPIHEPNKTIVFDVNGGNITSINLKQEIESNIWTTTGNIGITAYELEISLLEKRIDVYANDIVNIELHDGEKVTKFKAVCTHTCYTAHVNELTYSDYTFKEII